VRLDSILGLTLAFGLSVLTLGCPDDDPAATGTSTGAGGSGGQGGTLPAEPPPISAKATVKFKSKERLIKDFQNALSLSDAQLCQEAGTLACDAVHGIALGGVDAYNAGIYEPLEASAVTTPIAVDRIALSMCQTRAHADHQDLANAALFDLVVEDGKIDPDHSATMGVITKLFNRIHLREPSDREIDLLKQLYRDIDAGGSNKAAEDWSALSCYAVISMMESVFY
jgi:hypothetical protein